MEQNSRMSEDVPEYLPTFYSCGWYEIPGRGPVVTVRLDRHQDDQELTALARSVVVIDGKRWQCTGVERFATLHHHKGEEVGLLVEPVQ